ncbi:MAG TPA: O-methyltransferase [Saprospiraceae bacterium]|nr:O-methyltransferase [Saprospiraceae bacterium]HNT22381.1 O-methyltransferase [Saprospiraceae bacterium]
MWPDERILDYCDRYSFELPDYLNQLERETGLSTVNPFMSCGPVMGRFLIQLSTWLKPKSILEIGSFTGYSALCLAQGLDEEGRITCIEVNEEYEEVIRKYFHLADKSRQLDLVIGDARSRLQDLHGPFDLVWIDANKQFNEELYESVLPLLSRAGTILVDNVLWYGNVLDSRPDRETRAIQAFNEKIKSDPRVKAMILPLRDGITIIQKVSLAAS